VGGLSDAFERLTRADKCFWPSWFCDSISYLWLL